MSTEPRGGKTREGSSRAVGPELGERFPGSAGSCGPRCCGSGPAGAGREKSPLLRSGGGRRRFTSF